MAIDAHSLQIVHYPAAVLRTKAKAVPRVSEEVREIAQRMVELTHEAEGIGLAAPQVGLAWRMFVVDIPDHPEHPLATDPPEATDGPKVYINPTLSAPTGTPVAFEEGCLSLPDIRGEVQRPPVVTITALDLNGNPFTERGAGLLARCWQHELDHLDGVLILDRMTQISRLKVRLAVRDLERAAGERKR